MKQDSTTWTDYSEALAFLGNSLLAPMSQTGSVALDPAFWDAFPDFGDDDVRRSVARLCGYAQDAGRFDEQGGNAVQRASVEYTRLFIGPPRPAAAPWETFHVSEGEAVGFGQATSEMRQLLRQAGLQVCNQNNQYADHIGIELLYASVLCKQLAEGREGAEGQDQIARQLAAFVEGHLLSWAPRLAEKAEAGAPGGYIASLLHLALAILQTIA